MLTIRLSRVGKKKQPTYRLIISEKSKDPWGNFLEALGHYNPRTKNINLKEDRIKHWLSKGAQTSNTVHNLLIDAKVIEGSKVRASGSKKNKKGEGNKKKGEKSPVKKNETIPEKESEPVVGENTQKETTDNVESTENSEKTKDVKREDQPQEAEKKSAEKKPT